MSVFKLGQFSKDTTTTCNNGDYLLGGVCTICPEQYYCDGVIKTKCASNEYCAQGTGTAAGGSAVDGPLECTGDTPFVSYTAVTATGDGLGKGCKACNGSWTPSQVGAGGTCVPCDMGKKSTGTNGECDDCLSGTYQDAPGQKVCKQCPLYSTSDARSNGLDDCSCEENYYKHGSGTQWTCNPCGANSSRSGTGTSVDCTCDAGYKRDGNAGTNQKPVCIQCPVDSWSGPGVNGCTSCGTGATPHTVNTGSTLSTDCICKIGYYNKTSSTCNPCEPNEKGTANGVCTECPPGQVASASASVHCIPCPTDTWRATGSDSCTGHSQCDTDEEVGSNGCVPCATNHFRKKDSTDTVGCVNCTDIDKWWTGEACNARTSCGNTKWKRDTSVQTKKEDSLCCDAGKFYNKTTFECIDEPLYKLYPDNKTCPIAAGTSNVDGGGKGGVYGYSKVTSFADCQAAWAYIQNVVPYGKDTNTAAETSLGWKYSKEVNDELFTTAWKRYNPTGGAAYTGDDGSFKSGGTNTNKSRIVFRASTGVSNNSGWAWSATGCALSIAFAPAWVIPMWNDTNCETNGTCGMFGAISSVDKRYLQICKKNV